MLKPIDNNFKGLITISGPIKSGKSLLAEYLIKDQPLVTYIATSKPRKSDPEWQSRINVHKQRRPNSWRLIEHPDDICIAIESIDDNESILIDSLGGLIEQHIEKNDVEWEFFQQKFIRCITNNNLGVIVVSEETGWGIVPATRLGHVFRERLSNCYSILCSNSKKRWLALNGMAIDLDKTGYLIP